MSLIDAEHPWFKANVGLPGVNETPRDLARCACAIADDGVMHVRVRCDARRAHHVQHRGHGRAKQPVVCRAPLVLQNGTRIGSPCVIDRTTRWLSDARVTMPQ